MVVVRRCCCLCMLIGLMPWICHTVYDSVTTPTGQQEDVPRQPSEPVSIRIVGLFCQNIYNDLHLTSQFLACLLLS